jgi:hypothetical protein
MSKANPKYNTKKRPWFEIYEDTPESDVEAENAPLPDALPIPQPLSPTTREARVLQLLPDNLTHSGPQRGLALHLIDRIQVGAHHNALQVSNLRAITAFAEEIKPLCFIPQYLVNTFCGFTEKASERARLTVLTSDRVQASLKDPRGRPRLLTKAEIDCMDKALWEDGWVARCLPWQALAEYCDIQKPSLPAAKTVKRELELRGWFSRKAARKPHVTEPTRLDRLAHEKIFGAWTIEDWKIVRFSDEKHWGAGPQRTVWVHRQIGTHERHQPENVFYDAPQQRRRKKIVSDALPENDDDAGFDIHRCHCWGAVGYRFKSRLVWYETASKNGKMNKKIYLDVLNNEVGSWPKGDWILEQDRDSGHGFFTLTASPPGVQDGSRNPGCIVNRWFRELGIPFYFNPADSPDLSVIENVWKYVSQKLQALDYVPASKEELKETISRIWNEIPQEWIDIRIVGGIDHHGRRIPSMQERWEDVRTANGDQTGH